MSRVIKPIKRIFIFLLLVLVLTCSLGLSSPGFAQIGGSNKGLELFLNSKTTVYWAKYLTDDRELNWNGGTKVKFDLVRYEGGSFYLFGDIETLIERSKNISTFNPQKVHYTIEPGLREEVAGSELKVAFNHQCKHDQDRFDGFTERWNTLVIGFIREGTVKDVALLRGEISLGKMIRKADVDYNREVAVGFTLHPLKKGLLPHFAANLRVVSTDGSLSERGGFLDWFVEVGVKLREGNGGIVGFVQYLRLNDVDHCGGRVEDLGRLGIRFELR